MDDATCRLLVPFDDSSGSYTEGFEAGMVWQRMLSGESVIDNATPYHSKNCGVFYKMADAMGYDMDVKHLENDLSEWTEITFTRRRVVRGHLSVVEGPDQ